MKEFMLKAFAVVFFIAAYAVVALLGHEGK